MRGDFWKSYGKRVLDLCLSSALLIFLMPLGLVIGCMIRWQCGRPVFFKQIRSGYRGCPFAIYKFRTMTNQREANGLLASDAQRITRIGRFLRATSLDEIPQLLNVLRGEMSLVGPRPLLMQYLERYTAEQSRRLEVRPGITGWAQVNGRNSIDWEEKLRLDVWYVDHCFCWVDVRILVMTVKRVLQCVGVSAEGHATMPEFMGQTVEEGRVA